MSNLANDHETARQKSEHLAQQIDQAKQDLANQANYGTQISQEPIFKSYFAAKLLDLTKLAPFEDPLA